MEGRVAPGWQLGWELLSPLTHLHLVHPRPCPQNSFPVPFTTAFGSPYGPSLSHTRLPKYSFLFFSFNLKFCVYVCVWRGLLYT